MNRITLLFLLCLLAYPAIAETVRFPNHDEDIVHTANGEDIVVEGEHGNITVLRNAGTVHITGSHHDLVIDQAAKIIITGDYNDVVINQVGSVYFSGSYNDVTVKTSPPAVEDHGSNNSVTSAQGTLQPTPTTTETETVEEVVTKTRKLTLEGTAVTQTVNAEGQDIVLNGSNNHLILVGRPGSLTVNGAQNRVELESTGRIYVPGAENRIHYRSGDPLIENTGWGNVITGP